MESEAKGLKEQSITIWLAQGYEKQLQPIKQSLAKPRGVKKLDKVQQRLKGGAKQKYPSVHQLYNVHLDVESMEIVKDLNWQKDLEKSEEAKNRLGVYFLRTNLE